MKIPSLEEMLQAGVHFGHQSSRWHPKMEENIYDARGGVHIINLEKTEEALKKILEYITGVANRGGTILFVGTKRQAHDLVAKYAEECGMPYVNERWLGGTLTNFKEVRSQVEKFIDLRDKQGKGELRKYTKKEQLNFDREIEAMDKKVGGIVGLKKVPEAIFVLDIRRDKSAVTEASKIGVKIVGVCDTNVNPNKIDYVIPANDDAVKSIEMMCRLVSEAIIEGKGVPAAKPEEKKVKKDNKKKEVKKDKDDGASLKDLKAKKPKGKDDPDEKGVKKIDINLDNLTI